MKLTRCLPVLALLAGAGSVTAAPVSVVADVSEIRVLADGSLAFQATSSVSGCVNGYRVPLGADEQEQRKFSRIYRLLLSSGFSKLPVVVVYESESPDCLVSNVAAHF